MPLPHSGADASPVTTYASVSNAGLFKTGDPNGAWSGPLSLPSDALALATGDAAHWRAIYAATEAGVYASADGGKTWALGLRGHVAYAVLVPVLAPHTVIAGTDAGIYRSDDDGQTWAQTAITRPVAALTQAPGRPSLLYAAGLNGLVWTGRDGGRNWTTSRWRLPRRLTIADLAVSPADPSTVYAATSGGLWRSRKGGSWVLLRHGIAAGEFTAVAVAPTGVFAAATAGAMGGLYASTDGGDTWGQRGIPGLAGSVTALAQDPQQAATLIAGGTDGTVHVSGDGGMTWSAGSGTVSGTTGSPVLALAVAHRQRLPVDGVPDPHQAGVRYIPAGVGATGHTLRGSFLAFWQANSTVVGDPVTEEFTDHARGDAHAQYFQNMELLTQGDHVGPAPLGMESAPTGGDGKSYAVDPQFLSFWTAHGGQAVLGVPVSPLLKVSANDGTGQLYPVQYFRNARLEYHAEVGGVVKVSHLGTQALQTIGWL